MTIELNDYGLMIDLGDFLYVSQSWAFIILSVVGATLYTVIKRKRNNRLLTTAVQLLLAGVTIPLVIAVIKDLKENGLN
jgi:ABC-type cobalamin transport system permease subunit